MKTSKLISTTFALIFVIAIILKAIYGQPVIGVLLLGLISQGLIWGVVGISKIIRSYHHRNARPPS